MAASNSVLALLKDLILMKERQEQLNHRLERMSQKVDEVDRRLVRLETMAEVAEHLALRRGDT